MSLSWLYLWAKRQLPVAERPAGRLRRRSQGRVKLILEALETRCLLNCGGYFLEGQPFTTGLDLFSKGNRTAGDFTTSINWEDGSNSPGTVVDARNGNFEVIGSHTYQEEAEYEYIITFHDKVDGSTWQYGQGRLSLFVQDAPVLVSGTIFTAPAGSSYDGPVGTITDVDPYSTAEDFTATISWGDHTTSTGTVAGSGGQFTVQGSHVFTGTAGQVDKNISVGVYTVEERSDPYTPFLPWSSRHVTSAVSSAELVAPGSAQYLTTFTGGMVSAPNGQSYTGDLFSVNSNDPQAPGDVFAVQTGEDTSAGPLTPAGGDVFAAQGTIDPRKPCFTPIDGSISDPRGGRATGQDWFRRQDLPASPAKIQAVEGAAVAPQVVARLTNPNPHDTYFATIDWGKNETSKGTVAADGTITGTKPTPYAEEGTQKFTVSIEDTTAITSTYVTSTAQVADAPVSIATLAPPLNPVEGSSTGPLTVATFTDQDPLRAVGDYTATINWGDDQASTATAANGAIVDNHDGTFSVRGNHLYTEEKNSTTFKVRVIDHGDPAQADTTLSVADAPLKVIGKENQLGAPGNQAEPTIALDPTNPSRLFVASNNESGGLFTAESPDAGTTWYSRILANGATDTLPQALGDPKATFDQFGNLFLTYVTRAANDTGNVYGASVVVLLSIDGGQTFQRQPLASYTFPGPIPPDQNTRVDQPSVATGPADAAGQAGSVWLSFNDAVDSNMRVAGARVTGLGQVDPFPASPAVVPGSQGGEFGHVAVGPQGQVLVSFLEDQATPAQILVSLNPNGLTGTFGLTPIPVATTNLGRVDYIPAQRTRGVTPEEFLAWDRDTTSPHYGRVYLVYTDAPRPAPAPGAAADPETNIYLVFSDDSGATWHTRPQTAGGHPRPVNDDFGSGSSHFFPAVAVDPMTGNVAVAWYDTRSDMADVRTQFYAAVSSDGGQTFTDNVQVNSGSSNAMDPRLRADLWAPLMQYGDYEGLAFFNGVLYPAWTDNSDPATQPWFRIALTNMPMLNMYARVSTSHQLAQFTDLGGAEPNTNYQVSIDWGDGTPLDTTSGSVSLIQGNQFNVFGRHAYSAPGAYGIHVTIADEGGSTASATAVAQVTSPLAAATSLTASAASVPQGQAVTFTATVVPSQGTLDGGSVTFEDGATPLATVPVGSSGTAVLTVVLGPGPHSITAFYSGDGHFTASTSVATGVTVVPPPAPRTGDVTALVQWTLTPTPRSKKGMSRGFTGTLTLRNIAGQPLEGPLYVVLHGLKSTIKLRGAAGFVGTRKKKSPFVVVSPSGGALQPNDSASVTVQFSRRPNQFMVSVFADSAPK